ncbi:MAG: hypothetical protein AAFY98_06305 [Verrucomicrobiota bacterium]
MAIIGEVISGQKESQILNGSALEFGVDSWPVLPLGLQPPEINNLNGQIVYICAFQSWCPGCHRHAFPCLRKLADHFRGDDRVLLMAIQTAYEGFSANGPKQARETAEKYFLDIPVGHSGSPERPSVFRKNYEIDETPWATIIDSEGIIRVNQRLPKVEQSIELIEQLLS